MKNRLDYMKKHIAEEHPSRKKRTPAQLKRKREKDEEYRKKRTPAQIKQKTKRDEETRKNLTPAEKVRRRERQIQRDADRLKKSTPAERAQINESRRKKRKGWTDEKKKKVRAQGREYKKNRTPAQKARDQENTKKWIERQPPEVFEKYMDKRYKRNRIERREIRKQRVEGAAEEAREAYWRDKPVFRTKEQVKELCKTEKLNDDRRKDILDWVRKRLGRKTPVCVCTTCGRCVSTARGSSRN